jgi:hypothetical protein
VVIIQLSTLDDYKKRAVLVLSSSLIDRLAAHTQGVSVEAPLAPALLQTLARVPIPAPRDPRGVIHPLPSLLAVAARTATVFPAPTSPVITPRVCWSIRATASACPSWRCSIEGARLLPNGILVKPQCACRRLMLMPPPPHAAQ